MQPGGFLASGAFRLIVMVSSLSSYFMIKLYNVDTICPLFRGFSDTSECNLVERYADLQNEITPLRLQQSTLAMTENDSGAN